MSKTIKFLKRGLLVGLSLSFFACGPSMYGSQGEFGIVDAGSRRHLRAELTMTDYMAFAEKVTNKMLASPFVQSLGSSRPRVVVGDLVNNTDNESIRVSDLHDRIQEIVLGSGLVRIVDRSANSFDYIIKSEVTSTRQYGSRGDELAHFTLQLKIFKIDGELMGQWSDDLPLARSPRSVF